MKESITAIKVRGYHADLYGHVNNARYLELLEEARWNHFENSVDKEGRRIFVAEMELDPPLSLQQYRLLEMLMPAA